MSYGFIRKMSPAAQTQARLRASGARYQRRLNKLRIDEVSSVSAGAGHGCEIAFTKGANMSNEARFTDLAKSLPGAVPSAIAKKLNSDLAECRIDNATYAKHQQALAESMFPNEPNTGAALNKFFASAIGRDMLQNARQPSSREFLEKREREGREPIAMGRQPKIHAERADPIGHGMDSVEADRDHGRDDNAMVDKLVPR
jgi:hypothetical protein